MSIFKLKQFDLKQSDSLQKMGSDTMLLGASLKGDFAHIIDIGTGTGILALMMAQKNVNAQVYAIEPHLASYNEADFNFKASKFNSRLHIDHCKLQTYNTLLKFDLIISNPPYYENSTLSHDSNRNAARHTLNLSINDFYYHTADLLADYGQITLIFPSDLLKIHLETAQKYKLLPNKIITVVKDNNKPIRNIVTYSFNKVDSIEKSSIIITQSNGKYSKEYISLTKDFYAHDLASK